MSQSGAGASMGKSQSDDQGQGKRERRMYLLFGAMIATSTVTMFGLTYTNAYVAEHLRFSEERVYMALLMGAVMAIIMLSFMRAMMYHNRVLNLAIYGLAIVVAGAALTSGGRPVYGWRYATLYLFPRGSFIEQQENQ